jgi:protein SCO1
VRSLFHHIAGFVLTMTVVGVVGCATDDHDHHDHEGHDGMGGTLEEAQVMKPAPLFEGRSHNGATFKSADLTGNIWIASFFFTSCSDVCPALNAVVGNLQREFGDKVRYVSITTDPATDTQEVLSAYARELGAQKGWWFVRMPFDSMRAVASKGFGLIDPETPAMHSTRLVAVDKDMNIVGYFDSNDDNDVIELKSWINSQL